MYTSPQPSQDYRHFLLQRSWHPFQAQAPVQPCTHGISYKYPRQQCTHACTQGTSSTSGALGRFMRPRPVRLHRDPVHTAAEFPNVRRVKTSWAFTNSFFPRMVATLLGFQIGNLLTFSCSSNMSEKKIISYMWKANLVFLVNFILDLHRKLLKAHFFHCYLICGNNGVHCGSGAIYLIRHCKGVKEICSTCLRSMSQPLRRDIKFFDAISCYIFTRK